MKRLVVGVSLLALGCGQSTTEPAAATGGVGGEASQPGRPSAGDSALGGMGGAGFSGSSATSGAAGVPVVAGAAGSAGVGGGGAGGCSSSSPELSAWPGPASVATLDAEGAFASDLSGLTYESPGVLWAVDNLSAKLFRLVKSGAGYALDDADGWAAGKRLRFPDGQGVPDAEGVTFAGASASGIYVSSERNLNAADDSRLSVLRYEVSVPGAGTTLTATHEWDVTASLPAVQPNSGLESVTWVPDTLLTAQGFVDESLDEPYEPSRYGEHGGGMFVVGVEQTGRLYGFALDHTTGAVTLLTSIVAPFDGVMGLETDRDSGGLWAYCDDTCGNQAAVLALAPSGHFELESRFRAPSGLPDSNNEGIALAPDHECSGGFKPFFWTDDADDGGFSLREGALSCDCR